MKHWIDGRGAAACGDVGDMTPSMSEPTCQVCRTIVQLTIDRLRPADERRREPLKLEPELGDEGGGVVESFFLRRDELLKRLDLRLACSEYVL